MSDIIYLKIRGEQQGDISVGCGTKDSIGNRYQLGHENEIFAFDLSNSMSGTGKGVNLQGLDFSKLIDKSTPLLSMGISNNEKFFLEFSFYRINQYGKWDKYYFIELRGATLSGVRMSFSNNNLDTETVSVHYEYILCKHLTANTEFSYLALPADYNSLFSPQNPIVAAQQAEKQLNTLNSKGVGRSLAAGGLAKQQADILAGAALGAVTGGMSKGGKPAAGTQGKNIVVVDSGKKGAWNKAMNKPEPNTVYHVDGNKAFHTDAEGRTSFVESTLLWSKSDRNKYQQCKAGKCGNSGDEGGHLIASIFNGPGEKLNLVPMNGNLNRGKWKEMENAWANALMDGKQVNVKIEPVYSGANERPDSFNVIYSINGGRPVIKDIGNNPGGMK